MKTVPGVVMFEGMPGSGKSTDSRTLADRLTKAGIATAQWPEGRTDHPVDFEQVALLDDAALGRLLAAHPTEARALEDALFHAGPGNYAVRYASSAEISGALRQSLAAYDIYDGQVTPEQHSRALTASWQQFGRRPRGEATQIWECVLVQNPGCMFLARFDRPPVEFRRHVSGLVSAIAAMNPMLVYLDPGDPEDVLRRAAAERPAEWLNAVIEYHTGQGYGHRSGLTGFEGYVEFMRYRRSVELALLPHLQIPTLHVRTSEVVGNDRADMIHSFATSSRKSTL